MNITLLKKKRAKALKAAEAIRASVEDGECLSDDELAKLEAHLSEAAELKDKIARLEAAESLLDAGLEDLEKVPAAKTLKKGVVEVGEMQLSKDPKVGFETPRDFIMALIKQGSSRQIQDERLRFLAAAGADEQKEISNPDGGFLVPEAFLPRLLTTPAPEDPISSRTQKIPMSSPTVKIPARVDKDHSAGSVTGGFQVARKLETAAGQTSKSEYERVTLTANTLFGAAFATDELLTDSPISFATIINRGFNEQMPFHLNQERLFGSGVGEYEGITLSGSFISITRNNAGEIDIDDVLAMFARGWNTGSSIWLANQTTIPKIARLQIATTDGASGTPAYLPSVNEGMPGTLLGLPIFFTEHCKALGTANDLMLTNWGEYLEGSIQGMRSETSMHVRFLNNEQAFKFWTRNDGRSWWNTPLTPLNGDTLSPFVGLGSA